MFSIQKKQILVVVLALFQLASTLVGTYFFTRWVEDRASHIVKTQILTDNEQIAKQLAQLIGLLQPKDLTRGSEDWEHLQSLVEQIALPNEGFLCVIDNTDGELLCHPDLRQHPEMMSPAMAQLTRTNGTREALLHANGSGWAAMPDGNHLIAVHEIARLNVRVLAHQKERGITRSVAELVIPIRWIGVIVGCLSSLAVCLGVFAIVSRYESEVAKLNLKLEEKVQRRTRALMKTRNAVIFGLAKLAESRDTDTGDHLERIRVFVMLLARQLQRHDATITDAYIDDLGLASSLHDIGKVGIPDAILLKPGHLDPLERRVMETHAQIGAECLSAITEHLGRDDFLSTAYEIAMWHHEKFDGTGYPTRISGRSIPLSARIVALADVYDALISPRVYKRPFSHDEARQIILKDAGTHFDPVVVNSFMEVEDQFRKITTAFHQSLAAIADAGERETAERAIASSAAIRRTMPANA